MRTDEELAAKVAELAERHNVPGVAAGVYHRGTETYACHGVTSVENPLSIDEHTRFQIGSTGKTFTSTALMCLAERGNVDLDAPVREYLPDFRVADEDVSARVTVLNLLNHTAGWDGDFFADTGPGDDALARYVELMKDLPQQSPLGGDASYNNAAVCLAGRVLEVLTGTTYEAAVRELVLEPLGLAETGFHAEDTITHRFSVGHVNEGDTIRVARPWSFPRSGVPAGVGLVSSVRDQIRYARFHLGEGGESVLSRESRARMQVPTSKSQQGHYGISWSIKEIDGAAVCAHGGTTFGQLSAFEFAPQRDFAITVLTNSTNGRDVYEQLVDWARERYAGIVTPQPELLALSPEQLQEYAGRYVRPEQYADITVDGDHLLMTNRLTDEGRAEMAKLLGDAAWPDDEPPEPIGLLAEDWFTLLGPHLTPLGRFLRDGTGRVTALDLGGRLAQRAE